MGIKNSQEIRNKKNKKYDMLKFQKKLVMIKIVFFITCFHNYLFVSRHSLEGGNLEKTVE